MAEIETLEPNAEVTEGTAPEAPETDYKAKYEDILRDVTELKTTMSKKNAEAADWKRKYREKLSDEERRDAELSELEAERKARDEEKDKIIAGYEKKEKLHSYATNLRDCGYNGEAADAMAAALADGDMATVFAGIKAHNESLKKNAVADAMANQSGISVGKPSAPEITQKQFKEMSLTERVNLYETDIDLYNKLVKGE